ncbi:class I SAM-dependent methyltransferase [Stutzerimonas azotifigens]|uniref:class I SAM-dependent methyltransferase n=1 Tax=Stutzerimonas azotifigens TaxID=291995 RepID=UPI000408EE54|nr:methyltransferase domain-containing protein [Stutzerimonas azotifigens]
MIGYRTRLQTVMVGDMQFEIQSLLDPEQYHDPDGVAARLGIDADNWALFGQVWPSSMILAEALLEMDLVGKTVLELGAGLALASLVAQRRGAQVIVSDYHPLIPTFLETNAQLNGMRPLRYRAANWSSALPELGRFDLIIGSDLLYHGSHPRALANAIDYYSTDQVQVLIVDPDRGHARQFCAEMDELEYRLERSSASRQLGNGEPYRGSLLRFTRDDDALPEFSGRAA